jgi:gelsolin
MPPHEGLTHLKEYDIEDSNVEFIGTEIDHQVKYASAETEPAWNNGKVGQVAGLYIWRIEDFEVIPWPKEKYGQFFNGDRYAFPTHLAISCVGLKSTFSETLLTQESI